MRLLGRGMLVKEAAALQGISESSMKIYTRRAMVKLGASTRVQAVLLHASLHRRCQKDHPVRAQGLGLIPRAVQIAVIARDGLVCQICGRALRSEEVTLDRVIPRTGGAGGTIDNIRVACRSCNSKKGKRLSSVLSSEQTTC